ncbi:ribonuclease H-like domain-containing protein [bacterium]|nr:ribonuclease H-like domain-containing protein [bacterium]
MIFLDIETKAVENFDFSKLNEFQISYTGVIDDNGNEVDFWEEDIPKLKPILEATDWIVGYNSISFDLPVIANYLGTEVNELPQIDLMVAVHKQIGFRPKLDDLVSATLGRSKIGKGLDATIYWANGELDKLREYCMEDVRLTRDLYEFGKKNGYVNYYDKQGFVRQTKVDWELGKKVKKPVEQNLSLF